MADTPSTPATPAQQVQAVAAVAGNFVSQEHHDKRFKQTLLYVLSLIVISVALQFGYQKFVNEPAQAQALAASNKAVTDTENLQKLTQALADALKAQNKTLATSLDTSLKAAGFVRLDTPVPGANK